MVTKLANIELITYLPRYLTWRFFFWTSTIDWVTDVFPIDWIPWANFSTTSHSWIFSRVYTSPKPFFQMDPEAMMEFPFHRRWFKSPNLQAGGHLASASVPRHPKKSPQIPGGCLEVWGEWKVAWTKRCFFWLQIFPPKKGGVFLDVFFGTSEFLRIGRLSVLEGLCQESEDWVETCWPGMPADGSNKNSSGEFEVAAVGEELCKNYSHITG